ncbi:MAG: DUF3658 domain-containing protein [Bradyrhizobium sp.]
MTLAPLHIVFTPSGASSLREALEDVGRDDQITSLFDCLSFGPINPPDTSLRSKWVESELGRTGWDSIGRDSDAFWRESLSPGRRKIAWLSRRSAMEYAGFLAWMWRMGDAPCEVIDLSEIRISYRPAQGASRPTALAMSLGMVSSDTMCRERLWDLAKPLQSAERARYRDVWQKLRSENAALRVIEGGELVSASISFFDAQLMSYVTDDWQKVAMIVGETLVAEMDNQVLQVGDMVLAARIEAMAKSGRLDIRGKSPLEMHDSWVRLPRTQ